MLRNNADARRCSPMLIFRAWATCGKTKKQQAILAIRNFQFTERVAAASFHFEITVLF